MLCVTCLRYEVNKNTKHNKCKITLNIPDYSFLPLNNYNTVYARINKIDWQNNNNPELVTKYQTVVDSYVKKLDDEYLNIKKQFDDIVDNNVKYEIDNVILID